MQADEITKMLVQYTKAHRSPETALIPSSIPQGVLDVLLEDTKNQAAEATIARPTAGKHITTAVLLLISQVQRSGSIAIEQEKLSQYIARYTQLVYLESLQRRGLIRDLQPEISVRNVFDLELKLDYDLTELGKQALSEKLEPQSVFLDSNDFEGQSPENLH